MAPDRIDRFQLQAFVGSGGMGNVYRAIDTETGRPVALKLLVGHEPLAIDRAAREAEALGRLNHPAIVGYVAHGVAGEQLYLAMDWIDGVSAADRSNGDGFTLREAVAVTRRVADALVAAHGAGILHRDIKPSNVILAEGDPERAMLIDFGIAQLAGTVSSLTRTGTAVGTPGFMSPEQARGQRSLSAASDVFGLGCLLYSCATAHPAFSGVHPAAVMVKILMAEPIPFGELCGEASPELCALVDRMLAKRVDDRIADGAAAVRALAQLPPVADGPRRSERALTVEPTVLKADAAFHCMVIASRGSPDDVLEPPSHAEGHALERAVAAHAGVLEILANGAIAVHLVGAPTDAMRRAASCALAIQDVLSGWSLAVSANADAAEAAETGTAALARSAIASIFRGGGSAITIDRGAASLLGDDFDVVLSGEHGTLVGRR